MEIKIFLANYLILGILLGCEASRGGSPLPKAGQPSVFNYDDFELVAQQNRQLNEALAQRLPIGPVLLNASSKKGILQKMWRGVKKFVGSRNRLIELVPEELRDRFGDLKYQYIAAQALRYSKDPLALAILRGESAELVSLLESGEGKTSAERIAVYFDLAISIPNEEALWHLVQALNPADLRHRLFKPILEVADYDKLIGYVASGHIPASFTEKAFMNRSGKTGLYDRKGVLRDILQSMSRNSPEIFIDYFASLHRVDPLTTKALLAEWWEFQQQGVGVVEIQYLALAHIYLHLVRDLKGSKKLLNVLDICTWGKWHLAGLNKALFRSSVLSSYSTEMAFAKSIRQTLKLLYRDIVSRVDPHLEDSIEFGYISILELATILGKSVKIPNLSDYNKIRPDVYGFALRMGLASSDIGLASRLFGAKPKTINDLQRVVVAYLRSLKLPQGLSVCQKGDKDHVPILFIGMKFLDEKVFGDNHATRDESVTVMTTILGSIYSLTSDAFAVHRPLANFPPIKHLNTRLRKLCKPNEVTIVFFEKSHLGKSFSFGPHAKHKKKYKHAATPKMQSDTLMPKIKASLVDKASSPRKSKPNATAAASTPQARVAKESKKTKVSGHQKQEKAVAQPQQKSATKLGSPSRTSGALKANTGLLVELAEPRSRRGNRDQAARLL